MIFLVDIDGTVADCSHRLHHIEQTKKDWKSFFADCIHDRPIEDVISLVRYLSQDYPLVFVSGRSDEVRTETVQWLTRYGLHFRDLFMRKAGDHRQDYLVKSEILDEIFEKYGRGNIAGAFDDRQQVVDEYRRRGIRVYQVAAGNF